MANIFAKWKDGLAKSSKAAFGQIATILGTSEIEPETWDDLEALLIQADLGVDTTDAILDALEQRVDREGLTKANDLKTALRDELSRRGARVEELACYRRRCPRLAPGDLAGRLQRWGIGAILLSSGEGLANLLALLEPEDFTKLRHLALIVPSGRVAEAARQAGFDRVVTADNASDAAMLSALRACPPTDPSPAIPETSE